MIIFLYGNDSYRSRQKLREFKKKFVREVDKDENNLLLLDGQNISAKTIGEKLASGTLFARKKMLIIENIFSNKSETIFTDLLNYFEKNKSLTELNSSHIIIFIDNEVGKNNQPSKIKAKNLFTFLSKQKIVQEFELLNSNQVFSWLKEEMVKQNKKISAKASQLLINMVGNDLWRLNNEVAKLTSRVEQEEITEEQVREMVVDKFEENVFLLVDAFGARQKAEAFKILEEQYQADINEEYLLSMLIRQFKLILQAKESNGLASQLATNLKLPNFVANKVLAQSRNFSNEELKQIISQLINLDYTKKSGQGELKNGISLLLSSW
ncbi:MAG: DNA polymerase III subunit delta [Planctomycetes bacterium]|jgi:DNA polymerase-3 subunit delta|nr:DNA polymerase III subunit delta [Planctomycetota bacterium]